MAGGSELFHAQSQLLKRRSNRFAILPDDSSPWNLSGAFANFFDKQIKKLNRVRGMEIIASCPSIVFSAIKEKFFSFAIERTPTACKSDVESN
jgi:hypothetical protein